ncbi:MAG: metallophosphoesterase family protein [Candidatus Limnocylindria bacterium]
MIADGNECIGAAAGVAGIGWYSYEIGDWHVIALNSNCLPDRCDRESPQAEWPETDLVQHRIKCTLVVTHHPRWSSGEHGSDAKVADLWTLMHDEGVEAALSGGYTDAGSEACH